MLRPSRCSRSRRIGGLRLLTRPPEVLARSVPSRCGSSLQRVPRSSSQSRAWSSAAACAITPRCVGPWPTTQGNRAGPFRPLPGDEYGSLSPATFHAFDAYITENPVAEPGTLSYGVNAAREDERRVDLVDHDPHVVLVSEARHRGQLLGGVHGARRVVRRAQDRRPAVGEGLRQAAEVQPPRAERHLQDLTAGRLEEPEERRVDRWFTTTATGLGEELDGLDRPGHHVGDEGGAGRSSPDEPTGPANAPSASA